MKRSLIAKKLSTSILVSALAGVIPISLSGNNQDTAHAANGISIEFIGRTNAGSGNAGSEITAFDAVSKRLFVTNGATNKIDIFTISDPSNPTLVKSVDLSALGVTGVQSVASKNGLVAAATSVDGNNQAAGKVFIMSTDGVIDARAPQGVVVGSLPDSVHFTPDGKRVLSANEGEPKNYCSAGGELTQALDPNGSVSIIDVTASTLTAKTIDFTSFNSDATSIKNAGGRIYGPGASVAQDIEPEYIAISADSTTAFITLQENNSVAQLDIATGTIKKVMGLGYKDHSQAGNSLDASDQDSTINIANWPVKGMYEPDNIGTFASSDGTQYFVTANEGDAREYPCLLGGTSTSTLQAEDARVGSVGVDGTSIAASVATNSNAGRLSVTRFFPATYTNGGNETTATSATDFTSIYVLGARSMSVWKAPTAGASVSSATLVADTGDLIERKIAELFPNQFNGDWNTSTGVMNARDTRSDNKGPEPEGISIGNAYGRRYAFVGLERIGGVMAFDITDPSTPQYATYTNSSVFAGVGGASFLTPGAPAGDVSPEGVMFIRATDSPIGVPLLVVSNELSGTTSIYKVIGTKTAPSVPRNVSATMGRTSVAVTWASPEDDGGSPLTGFVAKATPGNKSCTTIGAACTIKGLVPGLKYTISVHAKNATANSDKVTASVTSTLLTSANGVKVKMATLPGKTIAVAAEVSVKGRIVTAGLVAPGASAAVRRYHVALYSQEGEKVATNASFVQSGSASVIRVYAPAAGNYRVVVTASRSNGGKTSWNGPVVTVK